MEKCQKMFEYRKAHFVGLLAGLGFRGLGVEGLDFF